MGWTFYNSSGEAMIEDGAMSIANNTNDRVVTATGTDPASLNGEANLTFDGSILGVTGQVFAGETAYGLSPSAGGVIKQGAAGNTNVFVLKSSEIATGLTTAPVNTNVETDDYFRICLLDNNGSVSIASMAEDAAVSAVMRFDVYGGTASTNKTNSGARGLAEFIIAEHDGSNGLANITANGDVFCVRAQVGGATVARMMVDEDGELHLTNTTLVALSDDYDDNQLLRALYIEHSDQGAKGFIRSEWDAYCHYNRQTLTDVGILPSPEADSMIAMRQLAFVTAGATGQTHRKLLTLAKILSDKHPELLDEFYEQGVLPSPVEIGESDNA